MTQTTLNFPSEDEPTKGCFKCGKVLPLSAFYRHPKMGDGHLGKCKQCARRAARANNARTRDARREYERKRARTPERRAAAAEYQRRRRARKQTQYAAHTIVNNAIRDGRLTPQPCEACGATECVQAHHDDYGKPLVVRWLCFKCHREVAHGQTVTAE
jgi:hypothetical protein